jgi:hypothetical protein
MSKLIKQDTNFLFRWVGRGLGGGMRPLTELQNDKVARGVI